MQMQELDNIVNLIGSWKLEDNLLFTGQLSLEKDGFYILNLDKKIPDDANLSILLGLVDKKLITMLNLVRLNESMTGGANNRYSFNTIFIGAQFNQIEDIKFNDCKFSLPYLDHWIGYSYNHKNNSINYETKNVTTVLIDQGSTKCSIDISVGYHANDNYTESTFILKLLGYLRIYTKEDVYFNNLLQSADWLVAFLSVCYYKNVDFKVCNFKNANWENIFYYNNAKLNHDIQKPICYLIPYQYIQDNFSTTINVWFKHREKLKFAIYYLQMMLGSNIQHELELQLLISVTIIESLHNNFRKNENNALKEKLRSARDFMLNKLKEQYQNDEEFIKLIDRKFSLSAEPSLPEILKNVMSNISEDIKKAQGIPVGETAVNKFVQYVHAQRNFFVHGVHNKNSKKIEDKFQGRCDASEILNIVSVIFLMQILHVAEIEITNILKNYPNMNYRFSQQSWHYSIEEIESILIKDWGI